MAAAAPVRPSILPSPGWATRALAIFDDTVVHQIALTMAPADWQSIIDDSMGDTWRHASISYDGVVMDEVGVRPSGEASRFPGNPKMSVRVKFNAFPNQDRFGGIDEINIKGEYDDGSMMRERLALVVYRAMGPTSAAAHGRLVVNGALLGLYTLREVWDAQSIPEHFSTPIGPLYRLRPPSGVDPYAFLGTDTALYVPLPWEPHVNKPARGDDVIATALSALTAGDATAMVQAFDIDALLGYLAANAVVMNTDGFVGLSGVEDHFQYFDPQTGRFFILPWDPDNTFASQGETPDRSMYDRFDANALARIIHASPDLRAQYRAKITAAMTAVPLEALQAEADRIYNQIRDTAYEDPIKMFPNPTFDWNLMYVKDFAAQRYANLQAQVAADQ